MSRYYLYKESLGLGNQVNITIEIHGLIVLLYKVVAQSDKEKSLMELVYGEKFNCMAWVEGKEEELHHNQA